MGFPAAEGPDTFGEGQERRGKSHCHILGSKIAWSFDASLTHVQQGTVVQTPLSEITTLALPLFHVSFRSSFHAHLSKLLLLVVRSTTPALCSSYFLVNLLL